MKFFNSNATVLAVIALTSLALFEQCEPTTALRGAKQMRNHDIEQVMVESTPNKRALQDSSSDEDDDDSSDEDDDDSSSDEDDDSSDEDDDSSSDEDDDSSSSDSSSDDSSSDESSSEDAADTRIIEDPFAGGDFRASEFFFPGSNSGGGSSGGAQAPDNSNRVAGAGDGTNSGHSGPGTRRAPGSP